MVQIAWATDARVTWRCQPSQERPSKWSETEAVLEFAVVVLDAPTDLGDLDEIAQADVGREGGQPVVGALGAPVGHSASSQHSARLPSAALGMCRLAGRTRNARNRDRIRPVELAVLLWELWRQTTNRPADRPAAVTSVFRSIGGSG
ncbi:hypothetical protein F4560_003308 [Saccharothrix ecbatanensis]|uniref:Uncharacterized protein n=1 Tax=Saccharothrix ecbatanensis TaxID=1105145 RepID=A0A7W9HK15_9PSEU|nr:hypothetical protein [Saccharothrix ecbatanensis]MBB5803540.1 hypothetical protein [Saccharothrix ecbatanensis]